MRPTAKLRILILDIGENLVQIAGMKRVDIVLSLRGMRLILGIDDQYLAASCEHDVTLHDRQHRPNPIIQGPRDL